MKALWLCDGRLRLREDVKLPAIAAHEARVRVLAAGICGTDLALIDARFSLSDGVEAFAHSRRPRVLKVLLEMGPGT